MKDEDVDEIVYFSFHFYRVFQQGPIRWDQNMRYDQVYKKTFIDF